MTIKQSAGKINDIKVKSLKFKMLKYYKSSLKKRYFLEISLK